MNKEKVTKAVEDLKLVLMDLLLSMHGPAFKIPAKVEQVKIKMTILEEVVTKGDE